MSISVSTDIPQYQSRQQRIILRDWCSDERIIDKQMVGAYRDGFSLLWIAKAFLTTRRDVRRAVRKIAPEILRSKDRG